MAVRTKKQSSLRGFHVERGVVVDPDELLKSAGLSRDAERLRSFQARSMAAYEAGRFAEGDRFAAKADVLVEKIDNALLALEEEGEPYQEPVVQSIVRQFADAWHRCMHGYLGQHECRDEVREYRRIGHGRWHEPMVRFIGPKSAERMLFSQQGDPVLPEQGRRYPGEVHSSGGMIIRSAFNRAMVEHPEWFETTPGYFAEPALVYELRKIVGDPEANGLLLLDAAEDAWNSTTQMIERIRAGAKRRKISGIDPVLEAKRWLRRIMKRKGRTSRKAVSPNRRRTSRRMPSRIWS
jgi:hypothetical protein